MESLDLFVFSNDSFISELIEMGEKVGVGYDDASHVGICVKSDILKGYKLGNNTVILEPGKKYVFESTFSGVIINSLDDVIERYAANENAAIGYCRLNMEHSITASEFTPIFDKYFKRKYDFDILNVASSAFKFLEKWRKFKDRTLKFFGKKKPDAQFCSELVTNILLDLGLLHNLDPEDISPVEAMRFDIYDQVNWFYKN